MEMAYYFSGFYTCNSEPMQTYRNNGITVHKPPFGNKTFGRGSALLTAEFRNAETGDVTDEFYGACNDFNLSFLAAASKGDKFDVIVHEHINSEKLYVPYDPVGVSMTHIGTKLGTFEKKADGCWGVVEHEPLIEVNGEFFLKNGAYGRAIRSGEIEGNVDEIIRSSVDNGALVF